MGNIHRVISWVRTHVTAVWKAAIRKATYWKPDETPLLMDAGIGKRTTGPIRRSTSGPSVLRSAGLCGSYTRVVAVGKRPLSNSRRTSSGSAPQTDIRSTKSSMIRAKAPPDGRPVLCISGGVWLTPWARTTMRQCGSIRKSVKSSPWNITARRWE